jgi:hypothetical protein
MRCYGYFSAYKHLDQRNFPATASGGFSIPAAGLLVFALSALVLGGLQFASRSSSQTLFPQDLPAANGFLIATTNGFCIGITWALYFAVRNVAAPTFRDCTANIHSTPQ